MASVNLNYGSIENSGINSLESAISNLNKVISYLQRNSIPSNFSGYNALVGALSDIIKQRDKLVYLKDWLQNSNRNYDSFITKLELQANKLPIDRVKKRTSIIK